MSPQYVYTIWVNQDGDFCHCHLQIGVVTEVTDVEKEWRAALTMTEGNPNIAMWRARYEACVIHGVAPIVIQQKAVLMLKWQSDRENGFTNWYGPGFSGELNAWEMITKLLKTIKGDSNLKPQDLVKLLDAKRFWFVKHFKDSGGDVRVPLDLRHPQGHGSVVDDPGTIVGPIQRELQDQSRARSD